MKNTILLLLFCFAFASCTKDKSTDFYDFSEVENAVLVYIAGDNNLSSYSVSNVNDMVSYMSDSPYADSRLIVYRDYYLSDPQLFEVKKDKYGGTFTMLKYYDDQDSSSPDVFAQVLEDFISFTPARNYKLVLWSHGNGWQPSSSTAQSKAVLMDGSDWMEISELRSVLPDNFFDCILFDACLMGNIEVAYALRDKTNYIIASPSEVPGAGMPYDKILEGLFAGGVDGYSDVAEQYYQEYNTSTYYGCGLVGVYDMSKIEALKDSFKSLIADKNVDDIYGSTIQQFSSYYYKFYDFLDFVQTLSYDTTDFEAAIDDFVVYKRYKDDDEESGKGMQAVGYNVNYYDVTNFCGVSSFIPYSSSSLTSDYLLTDWYLATYAATQSQE